DLLLTDINMPDTSGLELHKRILERWSQCRVIYLTGYSDFEYARTALDQHAFAYVLKGEGDDYLISTIERAMEEIPGKDASVPDGSGEEMPEWVDALHTYIHDHLNSDLSLSTLAEFCQFHPVYLSHIYKEITGTTLSDTINQERRRAAEELLSNGHLSVLEVSRKMGFATDNYFCRWFRKQTGMTPHSFRKQKIRKTGGSIT
ncbi:MAG: DNA-binding response regulator, partial [Clostridia bacterium]|nr:DNA-binding response regulator [Clostridia bacterium]